MTEVWEALRRNDLPSVTGAHSVPTLVSTVGASTVEVALNDNTASESLNVPSTIGAWSLKDDQLIVTKSNKTLIRIYLDTTTIKVCHRATP